MSIIENVLGVYISSFKKRPLLTGIMLVVYILAIITFTTIAEKEKDKLPDDKFRELVASEMIKSINPDEDLDALSSQIKVIFNSYDRQSKGKLSEYGLVSLLEDAYSLNANNSEHKAKLPTLMLLLEKQKTKDPYFGLKFEQEVVIKNIEKELANTSNVNASFIEQIKEVVRRQNSEIEELKKSNSLGIPVGIAGVIATVIFGLLSLLYPLLARKQG